MSDEMNKEVRETKEECNCICRSKEFKKFLIVALGTFVGAYAALSLFAFVHRPPCPPCFGPNPFVRPPMQHCQKFEKRRMPNPGDFHRMKMEKPQMKRELPPRAED